MTNEKKQTTVEWLIQELKLKDSTYRGFYNIGTTHQELIQKAKEMEEERIKNAIKNELKLIGTHFDIGTLDAREQAHHIRFTSILKDRFDYYNEE